MSKCLSLERAELEVITTLLAAIRETDKLLKVKITSFAKALPGYNSLMTSTKAIGSLSTAVFLCTIGYIEDFAKCGISPLTSGLRHVLTS